MSVVELLVYLVILFMVVGMLFYAFRWGGHAQDATRRLDALHELRQCSFGLSEALSFATSFVAPRDDGSIHHQLVFTNSRNEVVVVYLDPQQRLHMLNYNKHCRGAPDADRVLTRRAILFKVRRPTGFYVEYEVRIREDPKVTGTKALEYSLTNSVRVRNAIK